MPVIESFVRATPVGFVWGIKSDGTEIYTRDVPQLEHTDPEEVYNLCKIAAEAFTELYVKRLDLCS